MKLYQDKYAPNPRRVRIFAAEKGIDLELSEVEIAKKQNISDEHLRRNPLGLVPVLELDDGRLLCESMAICRYLDSIQPEPALFGNEPYERSIIEQWNRHAELELLMPISFVFRMTNDFWKGRIEQAPEWGEICRRHAKRSFELFDKRLADNEFIAGDSYSVADITAVCAIDFGKVSKIRLSDEEPNLSRWYAAMKERPSTKA